MSQLIRLFNQHDFTIYMYMRINQQDKDWFIIFYYQVYKKYVHSNTTWLDWHCVQFSGRFHPYCQSALVLSVITRHSYVYLVFWRELSSYFGTWCGFSDSKKGRTLVIFLSHWWNWLWCGLVKCLRLSAASSPLQEGYRPGVSPMFPQPYVPTFLRIFFSLTILKIRPYVPTDLCSQIYFEKLVPMFPQPYVPTFLDFSEN